MDESDPIAHVSKQEQPWQGRAGVYSVFGLHSKAEGRQKQGQDCPLRPGLFLPFREKSCICTIGKCELIGELEGKLRQHLLQHKHLSKCRRIITLVSCCWRTALWLRRHLARALECQHGGCGTPFRL